MNLLNTTIELIKNSHLSKKQIADGAGVTVRWIDYVLENKRNPKIKHVQRVYDYLAQQGNKVDIMQS